MICLDFLKSGLAILLFGAAIVFSAEKPFNHFNVAVYSRAYETREMADLDWLESRWERINQFLPVQKIYLETHRDLIVVDSGTLEKAKAFFNERGVKTSGGITLTVNERNRFETFCYTNPEHRQKVREICEHTARHFNEIILDDFFFTNCKCPSCIKAKGNKSWTAFRLELMAEAARSLVIEPARAVNPDVKVVIKYPNWYEHFQGLGFNLEKEPDLFDGLYTGTETRDPSSNQHLQAYLGYLIFRYFENLKPDGNLGGWVDTFGIRNMDRYAEQLWLTLFAGAPEITLFDFRQLVSPIRDGMRAEWQGTGTTFNFDEMIAPVMQEDGSLSGDAVMALPAAHALGLADEVLGNLGRPIGIKSYKPFHSTGEDYLQNYFGMIGIPVDLVPEFPFDEDMVLLTVSASCDPDLVQKIKKRLISGKDVLITSGLLHQLQENGFNHIAELRFTDRKAMVSQFKIGWSRVVEIDKKILIPQIQYLTNDSWEEISALDDTNGWPILHSAAYGSGRLYILTIPDNFIDLYHFPEMVLNHIRRIVSQDLNICIEGPGRISLFVYDNGTFIIQSFRDDAAELRIVLNEIYSVEDLMSGESLDGEYLTDWRRQKTGEKAHTISVKPHSFRVFRYR